VRGGTGSPTVDVVGLKMCRAPSHRPSVSARLAFERIPKKRTAATSRMAGTSEGEAHGFEEDRSHELWWRHTTARCSTAASRCRARRWNSMQITESNSLRVSLAMGVTQRQRRCPQASWRWDRVPWQHVMSRQHASSGPLIGIRGRCALCIPVSRLANPNRGNPNAMVDRLVGGLHLTETVVSSAVQCIHLTMVTLDHLTQAI